MQPRVPQRRQTGAIYPLVVPGVSVRFFGDKSFLVSGPNQIEIPLSQALRFTRHLGHLSCQTST
jgi:hypothetical protein